MKRMFHALKWTDKSELVMCVKLSGGEQRLYSARRQIAAPGFFDDASHGM